MPSDTIEKVRDIIADQLGLSSEDVRLESSFSDDLGADDLDLVELMMAFEEEFEVDIDENVAERLETVQDVVNYVSSRLS